MKNKRTTVGNATIESKNDVDVLSAHPVAEVSKLHNDIRYRARIDFYVFLIISVISSLLVAMISIKAVSLLFSGLPQIPQAYGYLTGIVVSSIFGISVTFLLASFIDKKRKAEMNEVIERVRFKERELFEKLALDFDRITKRRR